jgi:hypothetical protein
LIIQYFYFIVSGEYLDFNAMVRSSDAHTSYVSIELSYSIFPIRPTGFFTEPSFFAMAILPGIVGLIRGGIHLRVVYLAIVCTFLTLSVAAFLVSSLLMLYIFFVNRTTVSVKIAILSVLISLSIIAAPFLVARVFLGETYDAVGYRLAIFEEFFARDVVTSLWGQGYFLNEFGPNGITGLSAPQVRDTGFYFYLTYAGGLIGIVGGLIWFGIISGNFRWFILLNIPLLMKYGLTVSTFWLLVMFFYLSSKQAASKILANPKSI